MHPVAGGGGASLDTHAYGEGCCYLLCLMTKGRKKIIILGKFRRHKIILSISCREQTFSTVSPRTDNSRGSTVGMIKRPKINNMMHSPQNKNRSTAVYRDCHSLDIINSTRETTDAHRYERAIINTTAGVIDVHARSTHGRVYGLCRQEHVVLVSATVADLDLQCALMYDARTNNQRRAPVRTRPGHDRCTMHERRPAHCA